MRRWFVILVAAMATVAGITVASASAVTAPIGRLGDKLQIKFKGLIADITVHSVDPRDLVSNVVLIDKVTGEHLAQWNV